MLNYGEPQILELMENTLPSRLYPNLFLIDNLRDAIRMAKCVMIKEKIDDSIDKLTSLVSKINFKMDRKETPYKPRVYQNRPRGQSRGRQQIFQPCNRSFSKDRNRNRGEITIGKTIEIGKIIEEITIDKETGLKVEIGPEIIAMIAPEVGTGIETEMDRYTLDPGLCQTTQDQGLDLILR